MKMLLLHLNRQKDPKRLVELPESVKLPLQSREEVNRLEELLEDDREIKNALVRLFLSRTDILLYNTMRSF